jgi:hypothetical protein
MRKYKNINFIVFRHNIELLFGTCNDEGSGFVAAGFIPDLKPDSPDSSMTVSKAKLFIQLLFSGLKVPFANDVADFYTKGQKFNYFFSFYSKIKYMRNRALIQNFRKNSIH